MEEYDPTTDTWRRRADMPTARLSFAVAAVGGKIYAIGGRTLVDRQIFATVEEYDPVTDTWITKTPILWNAQK